MFAVGAMTETIPRHRRLSPPHHQSACCAVFITSGRSKLHVGLRAQNFMLPGPTCGSWLRLPQDQESAVCARQSIRFSFSLAEEVEVKHERDVPGLPADLTMLKVPIPGRWEQFFLPCIHVKCPVRITHLHPKHVTIGCWHLVQLRLAPRALWLGTCNLTTTTATTAQQESEPQALAAQTTCRTATGKKVRAFSTQIRKRNGGFLPVRAREPQPAGRARTRQKPKSTN